MFLYFLLIKCCNYFLKEFCERNKNIYRCVQIFHPAYLNAQNELVRPIGMTIIMHCPSRFSMRNDLLLTEGCAFSLSTDEFMDEPIAMIIARDSPYIKIINAE